MTEAVINNEHKDRLFTLLFGRSENRAWTLELYNAVNGFHYDNPDDIEITTLDDALYMGMKNDVSFILNEHMNIYENQSSFNPNMPLRQLMYAGRLYDKYVHLHKLNVYGSGIVRLPIPKLVVFYNGTDREAEDEQILYLRDSFEDGDPNGESDIIVRVRMININYGCNKALLEACKPLSEYSWFIEEIRHNQKDLHLKIDDAVNRAIDTMPKDYLIRPLLVGHRSEVNMGWMDDHSAEEINELSKEDGRREGLAEGGSYKLISMVCRKIPKGKTVAEIADDLEETEAVIEPIFETALKFAPDYDVKKIFEELQTAGIRV